MGAARIKHAATVQQEHFIRSERRTSAFIGGIGSGKTRASVLKALAQPAGSVGMLIAPTFPMLKDALLRAFVDIAQPPIVQAFNRSELHAVLYNGTEVLFRSADNPERLRGPNLGWAGLDEAALMDKSALDIMIGRLRLNPGRLWFTTTPRGRSHWLFEYINRGGTDVVHARTLDNPFLPQAYLDELKTQYSSAFYRQEVLGEFIDIEGARVKREWLRHGQPPDKPDQIVMGVDLAISTKEGSDYTACVLLARSTDGATWVLAAERTRAGFHDVVHFVRATAERYNPSVIAIEQVQYQAAVVQELLRKTNLPVRGVRPDRDKLTRFLPLEARYEQGLVWHAPNLRDYEDELLSFPEGAHDDLVDAAAYAFANLHRPGADLTTLRSAVGYRR
jgi:predicted phage terminase large subunit-like protein